MTSYEFALNTTLVAVVLLALQSLVTADEFFEKSTSAPSAKCYQCHSGTKSPAVFPSTPRLGRRDSGPAINWRP